MRGNLTWLIFAWLLIWSSGPARADNWLSSNRVVPHAQLKAAKFQIEEAPGTEAAPQPAASGTPVAEAVSAYEASSDESPWKVGYNEPELEPDIAPFPYGVDYWFEVTGANRGLGYQGSYFTVGGLFPYAHDDAGGMWFVEGRAHVSENGRLFSNIGWGRRQLINPDLTAGVSVWYDYDGDKALQYGHEFHQVGISGDVTSSWWAARLNGYIPVNRKGYTNQGFMQNFVLAANGIDTAMDGIDGEFGVRVPLFGGRRDGWLSLGGYAYSSDLIESFSGYSTRLELPSLSRAATLQLQLNYDERFHTTGFVSLIYHFGSGGVHPTCASDCDAAMGPPLQRTQRNAHIVRFHRDPVVAINPATNEAWRIFHVDNTAAAGGDGSYEHPFDTLEEGNQAADKQYDVIFVSDGDDTTNGYNTNVALLPNQQLLGDGVSQFLQSQNGLLQLSTNTNGLTPKITNTSGSAVTLANGTTVSGFRINGAQTGIDAGSSLSGTATIDRVAIGDGTTGLDFQNVPGTINVTNFTGTNTTGTTLNVQGGTPTLNFSGTISNTNLGAHSISVADTTGGTLNIGGTISETQGTGLLFDNVAGNVNVTATTTITDSNDRGIYIRNSSGDFSFADTSITTLFDNGVDLDNNVGANISFENLQIAPDQAIALRAVDSGNVSVAGGLINSLNGPALDVQNTAIDMTFDNIVSANSSSNGLSFNNASGSFTVNNTTSVSGAAGTAISVADSSGLNANFGRTTITTSASGVSLTDNAGGSSTFRNLAVTNTNGTGLLVADGGTVNFVGNSPTIASTGGPAVDITGSTGQTGGAAGWTFASLSSTNSTTNGVLLANLNQNFTVSGGTTVAGSAATSIDISGGTSDFSFGSPVNITGRGGLGINVNNVGGDVNFGITNIDNSGSVGGAGVLVQNTASTGSVTFAQANVTAAGTAVGMTDNLGLVTLNGGSISAGQNGVEVNNTDVVLNNLSIAAGNDGVVVNTGDVDRSATIDNLTVTAAGSQGLELNINGTGSLSANISDSSIASTGNAFDAATSAAGGNLILALDDNAFSSSGGAGADVNGSLGGSITVSSLADNSVAAGGSGGMSFNTVTFDSDLNSVGNQQVSGGSTAIGSAGSRVQGDGLRLVDVSGDLAFDDLDVFNNNGTGVLVDTKTGGTTFNLVTGDGTINTTNGTAMSLDPLTVNMTLNSVNSTSAVGQAINLDTVSGTLNIGTTNVADAFGSGIFATNSGSLNANFGTTTIATSGSQNIGIHLLDNNGGTFTFNNLSVTTSTGAGFVANDGGNVRMNGAAATIDATGGAAIDLTNTAGTTNGSAGWTFGSLASTNSGGNGVQLENMSGNVTVTGLTTVTNPAGNGIQVQNSSGDVTFSRVSLTGGAASMTNGILLNNNTGNFNLNGGASTISTASAAGVLATNQARVTVGQVTMTDIAGPGINLSVDAPNGTIATVINNTISSTGNALDATVTTPDATLYLDVSGNNSSGGTDVYQLTNNGTAGDFDVRQPAIGGGNIEDVNGGVTVNTSGNTIDFNVSP
jgi:hypothetical protein